MGDQQAHIEELAKAHNVKVEKIKDLIGVSTHYKKLQKPNIWNAILHIKAMDINQGELLQYFLSIPSYWLFDADLPPGQKLKLAKLKGLTARDDKLTE